MSYPTLSNVDALQYNCSCSVHLVQIQIQIGLKIYMVISKPNCTICISVVHMVIDFIHIQ